MGECASLNDDLDGVTEVSPQRLVQLSREGLRDNAVEPAIAVALGE